MPARFSFQKAERNEFQSSYPGGSGGSAPRPFFAEGGAGGDYSPPPFGVSANLFSSDVQSDLDNRSNLYVQRTEPDTVYSPSHDVDANGIFDWHRSDDQRRYSPVRRSDRRASNLFGNIATIRTDLSGLTRWSPLFKSSLTALPCVDRQVRRQVMFAKRKAGRGYKVKKRRGPYSNYGC